MGLLVLLTSGSRLFVASECPWKVDVFAGSLCPSKLAFPFALPSSFQRLRGSLHVCEDRFAVRQDKLPHTSVSSGAWPQAGPVYRDSA